MLLRLAIVLLAYATLARADIPVPAIEGPVMGGKGPFVETTTFDLATVGYVQEEFFLTGDGFSYDMYSQAGAVLRNPPAGGPDPLGGFKAKQFIAIGESQSAFRMVNYIDAVHPLTHLFDGFLVHSRGSISLPDPPPAFAAPGAALIRDDVDVPVSNSRPRETCSRS